MGVTNVISDLIRWQSAIDDHIDTRSLTGCQTGGTNLIATKRIRSSGYAD